MSHTEYSGLHFQRPVNDWPRAAAQYPDGAWIKYIDNVQALDEAKRVNPGLKTVLRHFDGGWQQFEFASHEDRRAHARAFLESFIDATFMDYAHNVDAIEDMNEYNASSHSAADRHKRVEWARAICQEWADFRDREQRVAHIRLVVGNVAIGNDLPLETARIIQQYDAIAGYHPYVPFRHPDSTQEMAVPMGRQTAYAAKRATLRTDDDAPYPLDVSFRDTAGVEMVTAIDAVLDAPPPGVMPGEWPYLSGRWTEMDARFRAEGITVEWLFTEGGPIGYQGDHLGPNDGWRHPDVCGGDVDMMLSVCKYWMDRVAAWNLEHGNRAHGQMLFNSGGPHGAWQYFEIAQPVMDQVAAFNAAYVAPVEEPPPPPEPEPRRYQRTYHLLPQDATEAEAQHVTALAHEQRQTVGYSADDAFVNPPELTSRTVIVWDVEAWGGAPALEEWVELHYAPLPTIEYREFPAEEIDFHFQVWPTDERRVTQRFGANPDYYQQFGLPGHEGIDLAAAPSTPIRAVYPGHVYRATGDEGNYGIQVRIDHGDGYRTVYAHLQELLCAVGDVVEAGDVIGLADSTGNSTGSHLHLTVKHEGNGEPGYGGDIIDPTPFAEEHEPEWP